ncbi:MAG: tat (twin-arginine translocation) pathway signal sequence [Bacteroidetes bacterium RBG_13_46_8]|nr:MAG: tat (twin-arginine translocation) pathway signal sequence [Bacteroidetes bacterium RBG_13_46_8]
MKRRDFLRKAVSLGALSGAAMTLGNYRGLFAHETNNYALPYDMVAIKGGEPDVMFDKAIASLGGMKQFIKPNQTVVLKPNIGWDTPPERAANTNPVLVGRIVEHCKMAGAKAVYVFDNTCNEWTRCYKNSGIEDAVKKAGGIMVPGNSESYYHPVTIRNGKILKNAKVHEKILESDVFINIPILKTHDGAKLTISMKNLMGVVWDRSYWHANDLQQCIADFATFKKPALNIVDAYRVMKRNGPRGVSVADVISLKYQIISTDMVAADAAATKLLSLQPVQVKHIGLAEALGVGTANLDKLNIHRISL